MDFKQFVDICNTNNGFIMGVLTFVYVIATIAICIFNYMTMRQANKQIEVSNLLQKQNVDMQLLDMRKKVVLQLREELMKKTSHVYMKMNGEECSEVYEEKLCGLLEEIGYLFKIEDFRFTIEINQFLIGVLSNLATFTQEKSSFVFTFYKDDYQDKLEKFNSATKDFLKGILDEKNYRSICNACSTEEMCECFVQAKNNYENAEKLLKSNDVIKVFEEKYLTFK